MSGLTVMFAATCVIWLVFLVEFIVSLVKKNHDKMMKNTIVLLSLALVLNILNVFIQVSNQ